MKILLLNQFFHPDLAASAQLATDLAVDLSAKGHDVTVVAGRATYAGRARRLSGRETHEGVRILRVPCTSFGRGRLLGRLIDYGSFFASVFAVIPFVGRYDLVLAMSTPPFIAWAAVFARFLGTRRFAFWVQDVYPDLALELGALKPGLLADFLRSAGRKVLETADGIVAIGEVMGARLVEAGAESARVRVVENWSDGKGVRRLEEGGGALAAGLELSDSFVVQYSGNLGNAHDFSGLEGAIPRFLAETPDAVFVFVGEGAQKARLERRFAELHPRVRFLPYREREDLSEGLALGGLHLVTQRPGLEGLVVPSKLYGILAAGRPILFLGPTETEVASRLARWEVGDTVAPGDEGAILAALRRWAAAGKAGRAEIGMRARRVFERECDRTIVTEKFRAELEAIVSDPDEPGKKR